MAIEIFGNWAKGYALDLHTLRSIPLGPDAFGNLQFDTTRSEIGELVYQLKYKNDLTAISGIVNKIKDSLSGIEKFNCFISIPPSNTNRVNQPLDLVCTALSKEYNIPYVSDALLKVKTSEEIKSISEFDRRIEILKDTIRYNSKYNLAGKDILLFDDLYRSGATLTVATDALYKIANVNKVSVITFTKTRSNR